RLQRISRAPSLHLHIYTLAAHLQTSRALEANTSTFPGPQHDLLAPDLHTSTPPRLHDLITSSRASYLLEATRLQRTSRSLEANTSTSPGPKHASRALEANTSTSLHLQPAS